MTTLDPDVVLALVTSGGGPQSHAAIIARSLGLPAVVAALGVDELLDGTEVFIDGAAGAVTVDPWEELRTAARAWADSAATLAVFDGNGKTADAS